VVSCAGTFLGIGLGGADIESAINRKRIAADDFSAEVFGQGQRKRGLAAAGRTDDGYQQWLGGVWQVSGRSGESAGRARSAPP